MVAIERDLYDVLGAPRDATPEALKRAYRSRALVLHPHVSGEPDAPERLAELARAYEVLSRPGARLLYDRFGYVGEIAGAVDADPAADVEAREPDDEPVDAQAQEHDVETAEVLAYEPGAATADLVAHEPEVVAQDAHLEMRPPIPAADVEARERDDKPADVEEHELAVTPVEARHGTRRRVRLGDGRRLVVPVPPRAHDGQLLPLEDARVRIRIHERDSRLVRYAAAAGAVAASALFVAIALRPDAFAL